MACIIKYGLHTEAIIFPGILQHEKQEKSERKGAGKQWQSEKRVPATDVLACRKMQWLTISFPIQLTPGIGSFSSLLKELIAIHGRGSLARHKCKGYRALPSATIFLCTAHTFSQARQIRLHSPLISYKSSWKTQVRWDLTSPYMKFLMTSNFFSQAFPLFRSKNKQFKNLSYEAF